MPRIFLVARRFVFESTGPEVSVAAMAASEVPWRTRQSRLPRRLSRQLRLVAYVDPLHRSVRL